MLSGLVISPKGHMMSTNNFLIDKHNLFPKQLHVALLNSIYRYFVLHWDTGMMTFVYLNPFSPQYTKKCLLTSLICSVCLLWGGGEGGGGYCCILNRPILRPGE